jgi:RHS repeat-associated protein
MIAKTKRQRAIGARTVLKWIASLMLFMSLHAFAQSSGTVTYVYTDPQGTPLAETDANGNITATFEYTPYGTYAPTGTSNPGPDPKGPGYTGHVNDPETNLVYMQARYYDPATGHFLSVDPIKPAPGNTFNFNRYAYVNNNPILGTDPTGMDEDCGPGCTTMRRLQNWYDGIGRGELSGGTGMPTKPLGQAQATTTYADGELHEDVAAAAGAAAQVADAVPGVTLAACATGAHCGAADVTMGGISALVPLEGAEAEGGLIAAGVHGNSAASTVTTYLYRLTTKSGKLLKWGISNNPFRRYTSKVMADKDMQLMTSGARREMLNLERWIVEHDRGELNHERWAGTATDNKP